MKQASYPKHPSHPNHNMALIMAAGTGGHIMPGLAIALGLRDMGWQVEWLGTTHGMENKLVPAQQLTLHSVAFKGLRGKGALGMVKGVFQGTLALIQSVQLMRSIKPRVVVGMGGYICLPGAWAAKLCGVPLVLVNADADLLLSNQSLASMAHTVCCGFAGSAAQLPNAVVTGNPVRASITTLPNYEKRTSRALLNTTPLNLLVMGGSLGAQVINQIIPQAIAAMPLAKRPHLVHQAGAANAAQVQKTYDDLGVTATVVPFIDDVAQALATADMVIGRAGAITVSELAVAGLPSILIPFVASTTAHQTGNASYLAEQGATIHLPQNKLTVKSLLDILNALNRSSLVAMSAAVKRLAKPNATQAVIRRIVTASQSK